jgi:hypothetical protein
MQQFDLGDILPLNAGRDLARQIMGCRALHVAFSAFDRNQVSRLRGAAAFKRGLSRARWRGGSWLAGDLARSIQG